ncbi:MAG TPA: hypothetical protein VGS12_15385 [Caulobacteraceae bacterium]|nr:hypothetical protein [Caulobacteraceae bacterium]
MNLQLGAGLTLAWLIAFGIWGGLRGSPLDSAATGAPSVPGDPDAPHAL